jgi:basic membrane protein A and related proteins
MKTVAPWPLLGLACACLLSACGTSAAAPTPTPALTPVVTRAHEPIIALVTDIGGLGDRSFNHEAWVGLQRAHAHLGVDTIVRQSHTPEDYYPLLTQMARSRVTLVIAVGSSMATALYDVAVRFPSVHFALVDARPQSSPGHEVNVPNVANILFEEQQSGYLVGAIAGMMERLRVGRARHNTIAWMGGADIPPVDRYLAGFEAGARHEDPKVTILRDYAGTFSDPAIGKKIAIEQGNSGADIFFQVAAATGAAYLETAEGHGRYGIGVDTDQSYLGSGIITSALKRVDIAVYDTVRSARDHDFKPYDHRFGAVQGADGFASPSTAVPHSIVVAARKLERQIANGSIKPPATISTG